ncbi:MAG: ATP-binding protein, partial [Rhodospirillales bacterium]|nr:ATP-binding protein [Rhodospirillales bacterium]
MEKDNAVPVGADPSKNDQAEVWEAQWNAVCGLLRAEIGEAAYQSWLKPMTMRGIIDGEVRISVPTRFMRDWIVAHYTERLQVLWSAENAEIQSVDVFIQSDREAPSSGPAIRAPQPQMGVGSRVEERPAADISAPLDRRYDFEHFVVGKPNEFAYAAARRVAEALTAQFNPLFLYGGVGLGKTHLMHAIAWHIRKQTPDRTVIYLSAEKFMYRFIRALREKNTVDFKDQFRSIDVLMIDDVQFIGGKDSTQEEFFHTFNALVD